MLSKFLSLFFWHPPQVYFSITDNHPPLKQTGASLCQSAGGSFKTVQQGNSKRCSGSILWNHLYQFFYCFKRNRLRNTVTSLLINDRKTVKSWVSLSPLCPLQSRRSSRTRRIFCPKCFIRDLGSPGFCKWRPEGFNGGSNSLLYDKGGGIQESLQVILQLYHQKRSFFLIHRGIMKRKDWIPEQKPFLHPQDLSLFFDFLFLSFNTQSILEQAA